MIHKERLDILLTPLVASKVVGSQSCAQTVFRLQLLSKAFAAAFSTDRVRRLVFRRPSHRVPHSVLQAFPQLKSLSGLDVSHLAAATSSRIACASFSCLTSQLNELGRFLQTQTSTLRRLQLTIIGDVEYANQKSVGQVLRSLHLPQLRHLSVNINEAFSLAWVYVQKVSQCSPQLRTLRLPRAMAKRRGNGAPGSAHFVPEQLQRLELGLGSSWILFLAKGARPALRVLKLSLPPGCWGEPGPMDVICLKGVPGLFSLSLSFHFVRDGRGLLERLGIPSLTQLRRLELELSRRDEGAKLELEEALAPLLRLPRLRGLGLFRLSGSSLARQPDAFRGFEGLSSLRLSALDDGPTPEPSFPAAVDARFSLRCPDPPL